MDTTLALLDPVSNPVMRTPAEAWERTGVPTPQLRLEERTKPPVDACRAEQEEGPLVAFAGPICLAWIRTGT